MNTILSKMFSYRGVLNRKEYLLYGTILPLIFIVTIFAIASMFEHNTVMVSLFVLPIIMSFSMSLSAIIKRARDMGENVTLLTILTFVVPFLTLYLLFAPTKKEGKRSVARYILLVLAVFLFLVLMGIIMSTMASKESNTTPALASFLPEQTPPKCSNESVKELVIQLSQNTLKQSQENPYGALIANVDSKDIALSSIRTTKHDKEIKLRECKADISLGTQSTAISYTVQTNEENEEEFYVEIDTDFIGVLAQQSIMQNIMKEHKK